MKPLSFVANRIKAVLRVLETDSQTSISEKTVKTPVETEEFYLIFIRKTVFLSHFQTQRGKLKIHVRQQVD